MTKNGKVPVDIMVVGDLVQDNNLVQSELSSNIYSEIVTTSVLEKNEGGAWYLAKMIQYACGELCNDKVRVIPPVDTIGENSIGQAYQIWSRCDDGVFRISQFLGCQQAKNPFWQPIVNVSPKILVIDDLGMGYLRTAKGTECSFASWLGKCKPEKIVLKTMLQHDDEQLLASLFADYSDRLTIVVPAVALRARGARLSEGLSWDSTIEDTVNEFGSCTTFADLADFERVVILYSLEGAAVIEKGNLKRFVYDAKKIEGTFKNKISGTIYGLSSIVTAAIVRYLVDPHTYPLFLAIGRALAAARKNVEIGGGAAKTGKFQFDDAEKKIKAVFNYDRGEEESEPAAIFSANADSSLFSNGNYQNSSSFKSDLLADFTGEAKDFVVTKATEVVIRGIKQSLSNVPMASYGSFVTVDRQEIERLNAIRNLIIDYKNNSVDKKPLSIAVFGHPGSGKSFAIKQIASEIFKKDKSIIEFNLSQFKNIEGLHKAFHIVRDASIKGNIPLVFWDEFDSNDFSWLKEFLAPMQDAEFMSDGIIHPFGRAIFIFAGGVTKTFAEFADSESCKNLDFKEKKGPDFVSRLRGYLDVKGPNPQENSDDNKHDPAHLIRRAILIRKIIERSCSHLIDGNNNLMHINTGVLNALLRVKKYLHGARSLGAIIHMSHLINHKHFMPSSLPDRELLKLHVTEDFICLVEKGKLEQKRIEVLAEACHQAWCQEKIAQGYKYGEIRNDDKEKGELTHPRLLDYAELTEAWKEDNRLSAYPIEAKFAKCGFEIIHKKNCEKTVIDKFDETTVNALMRLEHDIWLRDRLFNGYDHAEITNDNLLLHKDVQRFDDLQKNEKNLDKVIVESIIPALNKVGFVVVEKSK